MLNQSEITTLEMADNYLEKRMEDYARGRLGAKSSSAKRPGLKYPHQQVLVCGADTSAAGEELVRKLVGAGCTVCFTAADANRGRSLAQSCGARFYPVAAAAIAQDIDRRGEHIDTVVLINPASIKEAIDETSVMEPRQWLVVSDTPVEIPQGYPCSSITGRTPRATAVLALALIHPAVEDGSVRL